VDKADAERLTIEDWENRPLRRRLAGWITHLIGPYL